MKGFWDGIPWDPAPAGGEQRERQRPTYRSAAVGETVWTIPLERFTGGNRYTASQILLRRVNDKNRLGEVWVEDFGNATAVYAGRFQSPDSIDAQQMLAQVREIEIDGIKPFEKCHLEPLTPKGQRAADPLDLRQYPGYYTLQVAFFDDAYSEDPVKAAKNYARELRSKGFQAYYYTGPNRSHVTVGLFTYAQAFDRKADPLSPNAQVDAYSHAVQVLQEEFPYNVGNGYTIIEKRDGESIGEQPSCLVKIN